MRRTTLIMAAAMLICAGIGGTAEVYRYDTPITADEAAALAGPDRRVEISADGLVAVVTREGEVLDGGSFAEDAVPFQLTPDWANTLRRQVGGLVVTDLNGDGAMDVAAGIYNSSSYPPYDDWHNLIYFNTGAGLETDPSWISSDEVSTGEMKVAEINGDAYPDLFAANGGFSMSPSVIYYGADAGPATTPGWSEGTSTWTNYAAPFDFDHDGDVDVATANQGNSQYDPYRPMQLFVNDGGSLATTPAWQSATQSIQNFLDWADLDGNGWEDLAVSKWSNFESGIYYASAAGLETTPRWTTGDDDSDKGVACGDIDGNGWPDLALGHDPTQLWSNDAGTLSHTWTSGATYHGHSDLKLCDVDADGDQDLLEIHFSDGKAHLYLNQGGTLTTAPSWTYDSSSVGTAIACGDVNGDGMPDLVVGYSGDPSIVIFSNQLEPALFEDGFESGDTSGWSDAVP